MTKTQTKTRLASGRVMQLPVGDIRPNPAQPRRVFDESGLQELARSILSYGVIQPLSVRRVPDGYELVAGERRLRAAKLAGLKEVPCILMALDELESGMVALIENLQRRDLDYIEEAEGLARLMRLYGLSQEQAAMRIGKSQSAVANKLRLLRHTAPVRDALRENRLSERHARALLRLPGEQARLDAISLIARRGLTVAQAEEHIESLLRTPAPKRPAPGVAQLLHSIDQGVARLRSAGCAAGKTRQEDEKEIVLTIRIPKNAEKM